MKIFDLRSEHIGGFIAIASFDHSILQDVRVFKHENDHDKVQAINMATVLAMDNTDEQSICLILIDEDSIEFEDDYPDDDSNELFVNGFFLTKVMLNEVVDFVFYDNEYSCHSSFKELCQQSFSNFDDYEQSELEDVLSQQFERSSGKTISFVNI